MMSSAHTMSPRIFLRPGCIIVASFISSAKRRSHQLIVVLWPSGSRSNPPQCSLAPFGCSHTGDIPPCDIGPGRRVHWPCGERRRTNRGWRRELVGCLGVVISIRCLGVDRPAPSLGRSPDGSERPRGRDFPACTSMPSSFPSVAGSPRSRIPLADCRGCTHPFRIGPRSVSRRHPPQP